MDSKGNMAMASKPAAKPKAKKPTTRKPAKGKIAAKRAKALVPKVAQAKADAATPPETTVSRKTHKHTADLRAAKRPTGPKASARAARDTAASKQRTAALKGRSQLNFRG